jgi:prepilin-type processing-associated H-X9-DG protein
LVVIAIIGMLVAILLPGLARARDAARLTQCASNLHQIITAMNAYAAQWHGRYPPNSTSPSPGYSWSDDGVLAAYLPSLRPPVPQGKPGGGVYICPNDWPNIAFMSYAMNVWASSHIDTTVLNEMYPASGRPWSANVKHANQMILMAEAYSGSGSSAGYYAAAMVGNSYASVGAPTYAVAAVTTAAERFGANGGISYSAGRFGKVTSELPFYRHRSPGMPGTGTQPLGRLNIAYADGHVASKTNADLVRPSGQATGDSVWSPADLSGN